MVFIKYQKMNVKKCVKETLQNGYRLIDTTQNYFNEEEVGNTILESGINRKKLFTTIKFGQNIMDVKNVKNQF